MIIIPARLKSTRFPNKVLAQIRGIPMIVRTAELAKEIDDVIVACDDSLMRRFARAMAYAQSLQATHTKVEQIELLNALDF